MEAVVGARVVRGPDWVWRDQDGGEGHLGTVAEVQVQEQAEGGEKGNAVEGGGRAPHVVTVQWDCGNRCRYRSGISGKYDLRVFDSGPAGVEHPGQVCNACGLDPVTGMRWKCVRCHEYSLCTECYMTGKHILEHEFDCFIAPSERARVPARGHCKRKEIRGFFKFAEVVPWCNWESQEGAEGSEKGGEVVRLCGKTPDHDNNRAFAEVQWAESEQKTVHMVGHEGKVELKCTDPSSGGYYYPEHLPVLGAPRPRADPAALSTGDLVRVELEPEVFQAVQEGHGGWSDLMLDVMGKIGTVVAISDSGDLKIRYPENLIYSLCAEAVVKVDVPQFRVGDQVRISGDLEKVQSLQHGHGDWSDGVLLMLGEVGRVYTVYSGGDVNVMVKGKSWCFNPLCLSPATDSSEVANPIATWAKQDADESLKYGLQTMFMQGQGMAVVMATTLCEVDMLRKFLTKYPDKVNTVSNGRTALHCAASAGLAEPMKILLEFNADVEQQDDTSTRALHMSASYGSKETTQLLVDAGADVNAKTVDGSTPAMCAASYGNNRSLKVLLKSPHLDLAAQDESGNTALHAAVMMQRLPCVLPLLDSGADPFMLNFSLTTAMHYAARMGFLPVLEAFLQKFPDCVNNKDGYGHTVLHCAAFQNQVDIIRLAMEQRGCDVDTKNDYSQTPLHMALARGNTKSVEKLVCYDANVNSVDDDGCSTLHYITSRETMEPPSEECPEIYKLHKALFGKFLEENMYPLYATIAVTAFLLRKGADIHQANKSGRSPYQFMPFIATLMTVLADYDEIIEQGGHADGSPLLTLTNTTPGKTSSYSSSGSGRSKKSRGSGVVFQDSTEGGSSSDYYGQSGGRTFMIFSRTTSSGYGDGSGGDGGGGSAAASGSYSSGSAYMRSGGGAGGAGGSGGAGSSQGTGRGTLYQDYGDSSYGYCEPKRKSPPPPPPKNSPKAASGSNSSTHGDYSSTTPGNSRAGSKNSSAGSSATAGPPSSSRQPQSSAASVSTSSASASSQSNTGGVMSPDLCFMCDNEVDVKFSPCGHAAMCRECAQGAKRCPVCKVSVQGTYNTVCVNCRNRESKVRQNCGHGVCHECEGRPVCAGCQELS